MSAYEFAGPGHSTYPPPLHSPSPQPSGPLSHHGLPVPQPYQYDAQPQQQQQQLQLQQQQQSPYGSRHVNGHVEQVQQAAPAAAGGAEIHKANRLRKACDSCSIRKVKCDETGPPCKACSSLEIPCTFDRLSRRRGPPNRHAEAIKKRRIESPSAGSFSSPTSPSNVAATLASFSSHAVLNAESICPFSIIELLVDDFFTYIHPLCPFPHEPSFRAAFKHREDLNNPSFLALLASMVGVLVASFPRRPRLHLKAQHCEHMFPNSISLVERCHKVSVEARGAGYLDKELSVYDAVTSYFLGLAAGYTFQWKQRRLYFGESLNIARVLGAHKAETSAFHAGRRSPSTFGTDYGVFDGQTQPVDYIRQEIGRRVFWILLVGIRSIQQLGNTVGDLLIPPPTPNEQYPPLPLEVDDEYIYVDHIDPQPQGIVSSLTGFNLGIEIYKTMTPLATLEIAYGIDKGFDWNRQKKVLEECLQAVKRALDNAPRELMLLPGSQIAQFEPTDRQFLPPMTEYPGVRPNGNEMGHWPPESAEARRTLQYEIQKANIYASQLGTRSYFVEKYWQLYEAYEQVNANPGEGTALSPPNLTESGLDGVLPKPSMSNYDAIEMFVATEREQIVKDLLRVLGTISQVNMEPNALSFMNKIRQIASTLVDSPHNRKGPLALKAEEYLARFMDFLMKLEHVSPGLRSESADGVVDEEEELRNWADLREYQMRIAQSGGFLND